MMMNRITGQPVPPAGDDSALRASLVNLCGDPRVLFFSGFDDCIVGISQVYGQVPRIAYSLSALVEATEERLGLTEEQAARFVDNMGMTNHGPYSPAILTEHPGDRIEITDE